MIIYIRKNKSNVRLVIFTFVSANNGNPLFLPLFSTVFAVLDK